MVGEELVDVLRDVRTVLGFILFLLSVGVTLLAIHVFKK